jgi:hypothetical protein
MPPDIVEMRPQPSVRREADAVYLTLEQRPELTWHPVAGDVQPEVGRPLRSGGGAETPRGFINNPPKSRAPYGRWIGIIGSTGVDTGSPLGSRCRLRTPLADR